MLTSRCYASPCFQEGEKKRRIEGAGRARKAAEKASQKALGGVPFRAPAGYFKGCLESSFQGTLSGIYKGSLSV